jgi:Holliday junction DNA helicase RuvA
MMHFIKGELVSIHPAYVVVETNQIGYGLHISLNTFTAIQHEKLVKLFTHLHVKNEGNNVTGIELFGFYEEEEKEIFLKLTSVSGIGVNTARMMLSSLTASEVERAILQGNVALIQSIKGIGPKTAQRAILELKDKIGGTTSSTGAGSAHLQQKMTIQDEALQALVSLGIGKPLAEKAIGKLINSGEIPLTVEELIKKALKAL